MLHRLEFEGEREGWQSQLRGINFDDRRPADVGADAGMRLADRVGRKRLVGHRGSLHIAAVVLDAAAFGVAWSAGHAIVIHQAINMITSSPTTLLLSATALRVWGKRIEAAVPPGALRFLTAEDAVACGGPCDATIAFMTREVTGNSSRGNPTSELRLFEGLLRSAPNLKWLQIHPAGAERPIYRELRERGVKVTTASGATSVTVAHSTLGALIALNRRFPLLADAQRRHAWEPRLGERSPRDLAGQCAVMVGLGPIGRKLAVLLKVLGMTVIGVRRAAEPVEVCDQTITYDRLHDVLPKADCLILCCPASPLTDKLADARVFAAMPAGAVVINVARGQICVEADLIAALQSGHLAGAFLDVFEREPLDPLSPLWEISNVMISPHTTSHSLGQNEAIFDIFLENLRRWRAVEPLRNDLDNLT